MNENLNVNSTKQDSVSITYEEIGLFPRSFSRVLDRFLKQLFSDVENLVIQEYRFYRYLFLTTLKCLLILFFVPFLVNFVSKNYLLHPLIQYIWNNQQTEIFLNSYQQKRAFSELKDFEEKLYFESLIAPPLKTSYKLNITDFSKQSNLSPFISASTLIQPNLLEVENKVLSFSSISFEREGENTELSKEQIALVNNSLKDKTELSGNLEKNVDKFTKLKKENSRKEFFEQKLQEKTLNLADHYNKLSIDAITNFFADLLSFITLCYLLSILEIQLNITKSFLLEVFFGLDDSKKSLLILLITDLLVGYHSSNLWELFFEFLFNHYGLPESQTGIFLLVATLPVLLDVLFKYLIFRHLNRSSPATVATYHAMIE